MFISNNSMSYLMHQDWTGLHERTVAFIIGFSVPWYGRLLPPNWKPEEQHISFGFLLGTKQWLTHKRAQKKFCALIPLQISEVTCNPYKHSFYSFSWVQCRLSVTLKRTSVGRCCALFFSRLCRCFKAFL